MLNVVALFFSMLACVGWMVSLGLACLILWRPSENDVEGLFAFSLIVMLMMAVLASLTLTSLAAILSYRARQSVGRSSW